MKGTMAPATYDFILFIQPNLCAPWSWLLDAWTHKHCIGWSWAADMRPANSEHGAAPLCFSMLMNAGAAFQHLLE